MELNLRHDASNESTGKIPATEVNPVVVEQVPLENTNEQISSFDANTAIEYVNHLTADTEKSTQNLVDGYTARLKSVDGFSAYETEYSHVTGELIKGTAQASAEYKNDVRTLYEGEIEDAPVTPKPHEDEIIDAEFTVREEAIPVGEKLTPEERAEINHDDILDQLDPVENSERQPRAEPEVVNKEGIAPGVKIETEDTLSSNPHIEQTRTEIKDLVDNGNAPESTFAVIRRNTPKIFHGLIDKMEAKSETKTVNKMYKNLSVLTAQRESARIRLEQLIPESRDYQKAKKEHDALTARYDINSAEIAVYEKRRNQAVDRVTSKLNEKIAPREQKIEELRFDQKNYQETVDKFTEKNKELTSKLVEYRQKISTGEVTDKKMLRNINKLLNDLDKQVRANEKTITKEQVKVYKLEAKISPLTGKLDAWKAQKEGFEKLHRKDQSEKYAPRPEQGQEQQDAQKILNAEQEELPLEEDTEKPVEQNQQVTSEQVIAAEVAPVAVQEEIVKTPEHPQEVDTTFEKEPQTFAEYVSAWNQFAGTLRGGESMKIKFTPEERQLQEDIEAKFKAMKGNYDADMNDLLPRQMRDYITVYREYRKQEEEMNDKIAFEKQKNPYFKATEEWKNDFAKKWQKEWSGSSYFGLKKSSRALDRTQFNHDTERLFSDFYEKMFGKLI